jgi:hypothetical protein
LALDSVTFAISSTLERRKVECERHKFARTFQSPWYYWKAKRRFVTRGDFVNELAKITLDCAIEI